MAAKAQTTKAEVHTLTGSTPPGASTHIERVATARPAPATEPTPPSWSDDVGDGHAMAPDHPDVALIAQRTILVDLVEREDRAFAARSEAEDRAFLLRRDRACPETPELLEEASVPDADAATAALAETLRQNIASFAAVPALTPEGLASKAEVLRCVMDQGRTIDDPPYDVLTASMIEDAIRVGSRSRFVLALLGDLAGRPVVTPTAESWSFRHRAADCAREAAEENDLDAIYEQLEITLAGAPIPETLFEQPGDAEFFSTLGNLPIKDGRSHFGNPATLAALRKQLADDCRGWPQGKTARIRAILDAAAAWNDETSRNRVKAGLRDVRHRLVRQTIVVAALRSRIALTPVSTLDGLLLKALVLVNCRFEDDTRAALDGTLDDLVQTHAAEGPNDAVMVRAIVHDLVKLLAERGITLLTVAGLAAAEPAAPDATRRSVA